MHLLAGCFLNFCYKAAVLKLVLICFYITTSSQSGYDQYFYRDNGQHKYVQVKGVTNRNITAAVSKQLSAHCFSFTACR